MEKVSKKGGASTKKGKAPMLVPVDDILFHRGAHKHRMRPVHKPKSQEEILKVAASKKAEAESIGRAAAIVAGRERRLLPPLFTSNPIFPPTMEPTDQENGPSTSRKRKYREETSSIPWKDLKVAMQPSSFRYVNNCLAGRQTTVDELGKPLAEDESDHDRMMRLSAYVMTEYDDRLQEVERYKVKLRENKWLVDDTRKNEKLLTEANQLKDQHMESLKRRNGENLRLKKLFETTKKQLEVTKEQLEVATREASEVRGELVSALVEVSELKESIPVGKETAVQEYLGSQSFRRAIRPRCFREIQLEKRKWMAILERYDDGSVMAKYHEDSEKYRLKGEDFVLPLDPSSEDESNEETSVDERTQQDDDDLGDADDGGDGDDTGAQSYIVRGSTSDEDGS